MSDFVKRTDYFPPTTPITGKGEQTDNEKRQGNFCTVWQMLTNDNKNDKTEEKNTQVFRMQ